MKDALGEGVLGWQASQPNLNRLSPFLVLLSCSEWFIQDSGQVSLIPDQTAEPPSHWSPHPISIKQPFQVIENSMGWCACFASKRPTFNLQHGGQFLEHQARKHSRPQSWVWTPNQKSALEVISCLQCKQKAWYGVGGKVSLVGGDFPETEQLHFLSLAYLVGSTGDQTLMMFLWKIPFPSWQRWGSMQDGDSQLRASLYLQFLPPLSATMTWEHGEYF